MYYCTCYLYTQDTTRSTTFDYYPRLRPDSSTDWRGKGDRKRGGRAGLYGREAVGHRVGRPARDQVKEGVARLAQHLELELDLAVQ